MGQFPEESSDLLPLVPPNEVVAKRPEANTKSATATGDEEDLHDGWAPVRKRTTSRPPEKD